MGTGAFERYIIAARLGVTLKEIDEMPVPEYIGWRCYFKAVDSG